MTELKKYFAVIGNPIHHSLSPQIHAIFAKDAGLHIDYEAVLSPLDQFKHTVQTLITKKLSGANVTLPFKKEAYQLASSHSDYARIAEAVNTLEFKQGQIIGHNTDGIGLVRDLEQNLHANLEGMKILLVGAGGAAEGVIYSMLEKNPFELTFTNRTIEKSNAIKNKMNEYAQSFNAHLNVIEIAKLPYEYFGVSITGSTKQILNGFIIPEDYNPKLLSNLNNLIKNNNSFGNLNIFNNNLKIMDYSGGPIYILLLIAIIANIFLAIPLTPVFIAGFLYLIILILILAMLCIYLIHMLLFQEKV